MNRDNIRKLAAHIRKCEHFTGFNAESGSRFCMNRAFYGGCGSPSCMLGHAMALEGLPIPKRVFDRVKWFSGYLGVDLVLASNIYNGIVFSDDGPVFDDDLESITPDMAADYLEELAS